MPCGPCNVFLNPCLPVQTSPYSASHSHTYPRATSLLQKLSVNVQPPLAPVIESSSWSSLPEQQAPALSGTCSSSSPRIDTVLRPSRPSLSRSFSPYTVLSTGNPHILQCQKICVNPLIRQLSATSGSVKSKSYESPSIRQLHAS